MSSSANSSMWSEGELWNKSKLYVQRALDCDRDSSLFPFWMSLALEFVARTALSKISPVLNAEPRDEDNILYGLGIEATKAPKTLPLHAVYSRCVRLVEGFESSHKSFCDYLGIQRNTELHTGGLPFENLKLNEWLARYYEVVEILCKHLGHDLEDLLGDDEAEAAKELLQSSADGLESEVKSAIAAHKKVFNDKSQDDIQKLRDEARIRSHIGVDDALPMQCPACESENVIRGREIGRSRPYFEDDQLFEDITILSQSYFCYACDLNLPSLAHLQVAGMEPQFTIVVVTDLHEHQEFDYYDYEYMNC